MGPEEIHIFFWEGAPRPLKENVIDPKTWKFLAAKQALHAVIWLTDSLTHRHLALDT